jgi:hypothetical protein
VKWSRGIVHRGEHEPIVDAALFEAVQTKLAASATAGKTEVAKVERRFEEILNDLAKLLVASR